jgi:MFS family permease
MSTTPTVLTPRQTRIAVSGLMTGLLLAALDQTIVATALKTIVETFDGLNHYALVVTAYLLPATASTLLYGRLSDLYGRRSVFRFAIAVFLLGSMLAGFAQSMTQLVAGRAVRARAGGLSTLTFTIIGDIVPPRERGRYQGYMGAVWCLAAVVGPFLGGVFSDRATILGLAGWRWMFLVNVPLGFLAIAVTGVALRLPLVRRAHQQIDYLGASLVVASVSSLVLALAWSGPENGWAHPTTVALAVAGVVLVALLVVNRASREPISRRSASSRTGCSRRPRPSRGSSSRHVRHGRDDAAVPPDHHRYLGDRRRQPTPARSCSATSRRRSSPGDRSRGPAATGRFPSRVRRSPRLGSACSR